MRPIKYMAAFIFLTQVQQKCILESRLTSGQVSGLEPLQRSSVRSNICHDTQQAHSRQKPETFNLQMFTRKRLLNMFIHDHLRGSNTVCLLLLWLIFT